VKIIIINIFVQHHEVIASEALAVGGVLLFLSLAETDKF